CLTLWLDALYCFFFSSRRRHTRFSRDWSSDVCSSDLATIERIEATDEYVGYEQQHRVQFQFEASGRPHVASSNLGGRAAREAKQIGRASCRERVEESGVDGYIKNKKW